MREALRLIDADGIERLSMRGLGAALGVEAMSLYNHVTSKEDLLDGVVDAILAEVFAAAPGRPGDWRGSLLEFAGALRDLGRRHPGAVGLLAARPLRAYWASRHHAQAGLRALTDAGLPAADAIRAQRTVVRFVLGFCLTDAPRVGGWSDERVALADRLAGDAELVAATVAALGEERDDDLFDFGLGLIVAALGELVARAGGTIAEDS